jgi:ribonuclease HI
MNKSSRAGIVLQTLVGKEFKDTIKFGFKTTNNETEYKVLIARLAIALELKAGHIKVRSNSSVVVRHVLEEHKAKEERNAEVPQKDQGVGSHVYLFIYIFLNLASNAKKESICSRESYKFSYYTTKY